jgi:hypothetical protein
MRRELFTLYLPNHSRVEANSEIRAGLSRALSGGDILNIALNAIHADANPAKSKLTQAKLEREIEKVRAARGESANLAQRIQRGEKLP